MKIPKQAKKVFDGVIFDVYHWEQDMYDGSKATFEALKRPYGTRIIPTQGDKIIVSKENQPTQEETIGTFGGRMDEGETPLEGAKRELLEESGLVSDDWELFVEHEPYPEKMNFKIYTFIARDCKKIQEQTEDPGEKIKPFAVDFESFIDIVLDKSSPITKEFALDIFRMKEAGTLEKFRQRLFPN